MTFTKAELERMVGGPITIDERGIARRGINGPGIVARPEHAGRVPRVPGLIRIERPRVITAGRSRNWLEKDEQHESWRLLLACGFQVKWLSQAWKSGQTKGIPDLLARHQAKRLLVWMEVKNPMDPTEWTPDQRAFCDECLPGIEHYVVGSEMNLRAFLVEHGFALPTPHP